MKTMHVLFLSFLSAIGSGSQEVGFRDLTNEVAATSRPEKMISSSGFGGMVVGVDAAIVQKDDSLRVTLLPFAQNAFQRGADLVYEIRIENVGKQTRTLPRYPNISDVAPLKPTSQYKYQQASISLWFTREDKSIEASEVSLLYGNEAQTGSMLQLEPGQSARIKAKAHLIFHDEGFLSCAPICKLSTKAVLSFAEVQATITGQERYEKMTPNGPPNLSVNAEGFDLLGQVAR